MVVKTTYRRRYVRAYYQMRIGFLRSTVYYTGDKVGVPHALKANRRMNNNNNIPKTSRYIRNLSLNKIPNTRRRYTVIAKGFKTQQQMLAAYTVEIASLKEELARLKRGKKRKAIPNPNRRFISLGEALAAREDIPEKGSEKSAIIVESNSAEEPVSEVE